MKDAVRLLTLAGLPNLEFRGRRFHFQNDLHGRTMTEYFPGMANAVVNHCIFGEDSPYTVPGECEDICHS